MNDHIDNLRVIQDGGSFRDPSGQVFKLLDSGNVQIIRGINSSTFTEHKDLLSSNFFQSFMKDNKVIETKILEESKISNEFIGNDWPYFLSHFKLDFISYPYEWSFGQLKDAAILHLELLKDSLENGWIIKDSTPYNIQFLSNKPIFIDTPSFTKWEDGEGWNSYRQFCMLFLYPLMLESYLGVDFRPLLRSQLDGIDPQFIYKTLGLKHILKKGVISHVILPYTVQRNILKKERDTAIAKNRNTINHSKISVIALVDSMLGTIKKLRSDSNISAWANYDHLNTYQDNDNIIKKNFIEDVTLKKSYQTVWDCGANTGLFSEHISGNVKNILAMDSDSLAVEKMYQRLKLKNSNITPLVMKLENMSPDQGFNANERVKVEKRSNPDLIMCLAIIHHIRISSNIPCENFLKYLKNLNSEVIIEFVNRDDDMVKKLLVNKKERYDDYNLASFEKSASKFFDIKNTVNLKDGLRKLFYMIPK